jgi:N-methylhydantoinase A
VRETRAAVFERELRTRVIERAMLPPGCAFDGPALVEEYSGTTLVPPGWRARVTAGGHLWLHAGAATDG